MGIHKGSEGTVHVGTDAVAEIRSYSVEENADTLETTSMGDTARTHLASLTSFSGSLATNALPALIIFDRTSVALSPASS